MTTHGRLSRKNCFGTPLYSVHLYTPSKHFQSTPHTPPMIARYANYRSNIIIMRRRQNSWHFPDDIFKCTVLNENVLFPIKIDLKFVPMGPINNILVVLQIMAWCRPGDKPEPMIVHRPIYPSLGLIELIIYLTMSADRMDFFKYSSINIII